MKARLDLVLQYASVLIILLGFSPAWAKEGPRSAGTLDYAAHADAIVFAQVVEEVQFLRGYASAVGRPGKVFRLMVLRSYKGKRDAEILARDLSWRVPFENERLAREVRVGGDYLFFLKKLPANEEPVSFELLSGVAPLPVQSRRVLGSLVAPGLGHEGIARLLSEPTKPLPNALRPKVLVQNGHLFFTGPMSDEERNGLLAALPAENAVVVSDLQRATRRFHDIPLDMVEGWLLRRFAPLEKRPYAEGTMPCGGEIAPWSVCLQETLRNHALSAGSSSVESGGIAALAAVLLADVGERMQIEHLTHLACGREPSRCDSEPGAALLGLNTLASQEPDAAIPVLLRALGHAEDTVKVAALNHLGDIGAQAEQEESEQEESEQAVTEERETESEEDSVLARIARGIAWNLPLFDTERVAIPGSVSGRTGDSPYQTAISTLLDLGGEAAFSAIQEEFCQLRLSTGGECLYRMGQHDQVFEALARHGDTELDVFLVQNLNRFDTLLTGKVKAYLNHPGHKKEAGGLMAAYRSAKDEAVRYGIVETLGTGDLDTETLVFLADVAMGDASDSIHQTAVAALLQAAEEPDVYLVAPALARAYARVRGVEGERTMSSTEDETLHWLRRNELFLARFYRDEPDQARREGLWFAYWLAASDPERARQDCLNIEQGTTLSAKCLEACSPMDLRCSTKQGDLIEQCVVDRHGGFRWTAYARCSASTCEQNIPRSVLCEDEGRVRTGIAANMLVSDQCFQETRETLTVCRACADVPEEQSRCLSRSLLQVCGEQTGYQSLESPCSYGEACLGDPGEAACQPLMD